VTLEPYHVLSCASMHEISRVLLENCAPHAPTSLHDEENQLFRNTSVILSPHLSIILEARSHIGPRDGHPLRVPVPERGMIQYFWLRCIEPTYQREEGTNGLRQQQCK
jgi:hypothetical protein